MIVADQSAVVGGGGTAGKRGLAGQGPTADSVADGVPWCQTAAAPLGSLSEAKSVYEQGADGGVD
jgi:hypothetical protein